MKKLKSQSGRSMVEMLGVLAIIGVLSVGGIAGYSLSMRRHRANGIVDAVAKYAALNYGRCQQKIINGEAGKNSIGDIVVGQIVGCSSGVFPKFTATDLGQLPAGVLSISHGKVEILPNSQGDAVTTYVAFTDTKLCQTVASIVGLSATSCGSNTLEVEIKQN